MRRLLLTALIALAPVSSTATQKPDPRPNILFAIADDWSFPHAGAYGDATVSTPTFDRIAREGALFMHAYTGAPSCTPSRAALLTGQAVHRLAEGGNLWGFLPERFAVYPDILERAGYVVGFMGKGWGPGQFEPGGRSRNPAGPVVKQFEDFLATRRNGQPFAFWFGSNDPHRPYEAGAGAKLGLRRESVTIPPFFPDTPDVRSDLLDYYFEVQRSDGQVARLIQALEKEGILDNTIVVMTSDNGMPFPRAKANLYDAGTRMPLAIRWPGRIKAGTTVQAFVSHTDLAPTLLEASGQPVPADMTGRSLLPLFGSAAATDAATRDRVFIERERHANVRRGDLSYPARAIRTADYLYIRNYRPDRWPAGDPDVYVSVGPFGDIDDGPTKQLLLNKREDPAIKRYFELAVAKRPAEELYDLKKDPSQIVNVAADRAYAATRERLRQALDAWQKKTADPRATSDDDRWDKYPYYGAPAKSK